MEPSESELSSLLYENDRYKNYFELDDYSRKYSSNKNSKLYYIPISFFVFITLILLFTAFNSNSLKNSTQPPNEPLKNSLQSPFLKASDWKANSTSSVNFTLEISHGRSSPDGVENDVFLINGQFPGPTLRIPKNSLLYITLINNLNVSITLHLHGIHQKRSFLSDGVPGLTQDPIEPGQSYTYATNTSPQVGTFFYHAHTLMNIVWVLGPLIIEEDPALLSTLPPDYSYDGDHTFLLSGIYHDPLPSIVNRIIGPVFDFPSQDSVLINGRSHFSLNPNSTVVSNLNGSRGVSSNVDLHVTSVRPGLSYRFRFINGAPNGIFSCRIAGHSFTVIEMDGIYTEPVETNTILLSPGQRYSAIIKMDRSPNNYFLICTHLDFAGPLALSIIKYEESPSSTLPPLPNNSLNSSLNSLPLLTNSDSTITSPTSDPRSIPLSWIVDQLTPKVGLGQTEVYPFPTKVDSEIVIISSEAIIDTKHVYEINGHRYRDPPSPYFEELSNKVNISDPPQVFEIKTGEVIQFIFQNIDNGTCFAHPWHVHGHSFYVVGSGPGAYDPVKGHQIIASRIKKGHMEFRDTVTVNGDGGGGGNAPYCGWAAIRFVANNPGVWLAHCHIVPHLMMGKKFVMWEHDEDDPYLSEHFSTNYT